MRILWAVGLVFLMGCAPSWTVKKEVNTSTVMLGGAVNGGVPANKTTTKVYLCDSDRCYEVHSSDWYSQ